MGIYTRVQPHGELCPDGRCGYDPARAKALADAYGCRAETDPNAILDSVDAVTISRRLRRTVRWLNFFLNTDSCAD